VNALPFDLKKATGLQNILHELINRHLNALDPKYCSLAAGQGLPVASHAANSIRYLVVGVLLTTRKGDYLTSENRVDSGRRRFLVASSIKDEHLDSRHNVILALLKQDRKLRPLVVSSGRSCSSTNSATAAPTALFEGIPGKRRWSRRQGTGPQRHSDACYLVRPEQPRAHDARAHDSRANRNDDSKIFGQYNCRQWRYGRPLDGSR
jgi:hypothetical protein